MTWHLINIYLLIHLTSVYLFTAKAVTMYMYVVTDGMLSSAIKVSLHTIYMFNFIFAKQPCKHQNTRKVHVSISTTSTWFLLCEFCVTFLLVMYFVACSFSWLQFLIVSVLIISGNAPILLLTGLTSNCSAINTTSTSCHQNNSIIPTLSLQFLPIWNASGKLN